MTPIHYVRRGGGEPLVLAHGIGSQWRAFEPVMSRLAHEHDVIAIDLPGFGASPHDGTGPSPEAQAARLVRFFDEIDVQRPHVAGNSMGGAIALELARLGAVASPTAVSPIGFWTPRERAYAKALLATGRRGLAVSRPALPRMLDTAAGRTALLGAFFGRPTAMAPDVALDHIDRLIGAERFDACLAAFDGYTFHDAQDLERVPVTVAWGERDYLLLYRQAARAARVMPKASHVTLRGCGHVPFGDDPATVASVMLAAARRGAATATA